MRGKINGWQSTTTDLTDYRDCAVPLLWDITSQRPRSALALVLVHNRSASPLPSSTVYYVSIPTHQQDRCSSTFLAWASSNTDHTPVFAVYRVRKHCQTRRPEDKDDLIQSTSKLGAVHHALYTVELLTRSLTSILIIPKKHSSYEPYLGERVTLSDTLSRLF